MLGVEDPASDPMSGWALVTSFAHLGMEWGVDTEEGLFNISSVISEVFVENLLLLLITNFGLRGTSTPRPLSPGPETPKADAGRGQETHEGALTRPPRTELDE